jgi:DHA2 family multidrug resistance protein
MNAVAPAGAASPAGRAYDPYAHRYLIAIGVILGAVMELIDTSIVNVALADIGANLGATLDELTWVITGYILSAIIVLPMTGWLAARFGRRRYFLASITLFTVASFFCGTAGSLVSLVFWRIVQGLGGGALIATAQAILFDAFPPNQKTVAAAIFGLGMIVGPAIGPTLGGVIVTKYAWPWIFYVNLPVGALSLLIVSAFVHDDPRDKHPAGRIDVVGLGLLAIGLGSLQFVLERGEHYDWFDSRLIVALSIVATLALVTMLVWELRAEDPILDLHVLRDRSLASGSLFAVALGFALYGSIFTEPLFMQNILHFDAETSGWTLFPGAVAAAFVMMPMARLGNRVDARWTVSIGAALLAFSMVLHSHLTADAGRDDWFWPIVTRGLGTGMIFVPLTAAAVSGLRGRLLGHGTALFNLARQLGGSAGLAIMSTYLTRDVATNRAVLVEHVTTDGFGTRMRLGMMQRGFEAHGADPITAMRQALAALDGIVTQQSYVLAFEHLYLWIGLVMVVALPLVFLLRRPSAVGMPAH